MRWRPAWSSRARRRRTSRASVRRRRWRTCTTPTRSRPIRARSPAAARSPTPRPIRRRRTCSTRSSLGPQWELTGGLRWDRFDVDYTSMAVTGVATELGRTDEMVSWRGGVVYKPRANGSVYGGYSTAFNPSAEGLSLTAATAVIEPEKTNSLEVGHRMGRVPREAVAGRGVLQDGQDQRADAGRQPRRSADRARRRAAGDRHRAGRVGPHRRPVVRCRPATPRCRATSRRPTRRPKWTTPWRSCPSRPFNIWATYEFPWKLTLGGGAQYMDSVYRNATNTATRAELLADEHAGVVRGEPSPDAAAQRHQPGRRGLRRSHRRRPLHSRAGRGRHRQLDVKF